MLRDGVRASSGGWRFRPQPQHTMQRILTPLIQTVVCLALTLGLAAQAQDDKKDKKKSDASGTWTWSRPGRDGGDPIKSTLKLKVEGDKVTGTMSAPGRQGGEARETEITDGKISGEDISFTVKRERQGNTFVAKYSGKITGDSIKGKIETEREGNTQSRDWEAKREAAK